MHCRNGTHSYVGDLLCSIVYIYHILFIHSSVDGHLGCFHVLATVNTATMNIGVHMSFGIRAFVFFRYVPGIGIAGSYVTDIPLPLGNHKYVLYVCESVSV